ncbi:MAG: 50S ribosomal protein L7/L12 [Candidatus Fermentibacteraceae bacterium]|nr:50S ribosomal protein L7/L12 [Candidatus Fermentibacteraceae bacterium]MBN2609754.1 50S ribosomal protein L7/L12 [Candidatus Fermentibacteraceae bacterium]
MSELKKADIIEAISSMTVLELAELVEEMEQKFGVSAAAPAAAAVAAPAVTAGAVEEKTEFDVILEDFGSKKIPVIKIVKDALELNLKEAKELVDNVPSKLREEMDKDEAEALKKQLEEAGATVKLQ